MDHKKGSQFVKRDNVCMALYLMVSAPYNALTIAKMLGVSRQTANNYFNDLLECGFIKERGRGRFVASSYGSKLCTQFMGLMFSEAIELGSKIVSEKAIEVVKQYELWKGFI